MKIPATVVGIYGTVHTSLGDIRTKGPERITVDCELFTFYLPIEKMPFAARMTSITLHFGIHSTECQIVPSVAALKGDRVTIVQPFGVLGINPVPGE